MTDPRPLYRQLTRPRLGAAPVATLQATRSTIHDGAYDLDTGRARLRTGWRGAGADAADHALQRRCAQLSAADAELGAAIALLAALADEQERVRHAAAPLIGWWCRSYVLFVFTNPVLLALVSAQVCTALQRLRATHRAELERIAAGFDRLGGGADAPPVVTAVRAMPPPGTAPQTVAAWWKGLTPAQQAALQAQYPDELAELTGLPPTVLDAINRSRVATDRTTAQAAVDHANDGLRARGVVGLPDSMLLDNTDPEVRRLAREHATAVTQLEHTNQTDAAVRSAAEASAAPHPPIGPVLLLKYRNTGAGGLAISFGDPSKAHDVAVNVPGTTAGPGTPSLDEATNLRRAMDSKDPAGSHAVVQWVDYDAPDSIASTDVARPDQAQEGAPRLVADVAGWRAAAGGNQHVTAIGHSYGSTLVGFAGQHGLQADDIAVVGSPGVGASSADGLSPGRAHVWAGSAEHDPVVQVSGGDWYTTNGSGVGPYDESFGATQFDATSHDPLNHAHSTYYDEGSPALRNLAAISTGDYTAVSNADLGDTALGIRSPLDQARESAEDVFRGGSRAATELFTGHPDAALATAAATGVEAVSDLLDARLGPLGAVLNIPAPVIKDVLGQFF